MVHTGHVTMNKEAVTSWAFSGYACLIGVTLNHYDVVGRGWGDWTDW